MTPVVGAVIVTYRREDVLLDTLAAVVDQELRPTHVVVVDNAASPALEHRLTARYPDVAYVAADDNDGYGAGLTVGMKWLRERHPCDWFWLLDDDSPPSPDALAAAVRHGSDRPRVGVVANRGGHLSLGRIRHDIEGVSGNAAVSADFTLVDGSIVSGDVVDAVGYPRSDLFMMLEDVEYTTRIAEAGWTLLVRPRDESSFLHLGSAAPWRGYYQSRNHLRIAIDRRSAVWLFGWLYRELAVAVSLVRRRRWHALRLRLAGARDGLLGRMGRTVLPGS